MTIWKEYCGQRGELVVSNTIALHEFSADAALHRAALEGHDRSRDKDVIGTRAAGISNEFYLSKELCLDVVELLFEFGCAAAADGPGVGVEAVAGGVGDADVVALAVGVVGLVGDGGPDEAFSGVDRRGGFTTDAHDGADCWA